MVDEFDGDGSSEEFNPYEPGEAAVDPAMPADPTGGGSLQIAPTAPPGEPSIARMMENFNIVLDRGFGSVGISWLLLMLGCYVGGGVVGAAMFLMIPGMSAAGVDPSIIAGGGFTALMLFAGLVGIVIGSLFVGLTRALRAVAFGGEHTISDIGSAYSVAFERFWTILGMVVVWWLILAATMGALVFVGAQLEAPILAIGGYLVALLFSLLMAPLFYVVPATDLSLGASIGKTFEIVAGNLGYLVLTFLLFIVGFFVVACGMGLLGIIPILGFVFSFLGGIAIYFVMWVAFVTVFATIEETAGPFDRRMESGSPDPGFDDSMGAGSADSGFDDPMGPGSDVEW